MTEEKVQMIDKKMREIGEMAKEQWANNRGERGKDKGGRAHDREEIADKIQEWINHQRQRAETRC